ncbi:MAG: heavy metal translocating P-type ATPase, partial [Alphaproteobacteria bacterium]|nr:heavy metal translocating P-type ATPase [Alphaproteobacteria bacterium]
AAERLRPGMIFLVAAGERLAADGRVVEGHGALDSSLITGESAPQEVGPGTMVFAGTLNIAAPLAVEISAAGERTLLAEIVRLMEAAEQGRARYVLLADRVARGYAPVVHTLAGATFLGWWLGVGIPWTDALTIAISVLIVTCPCALALAVPAVQVAATGRLMRRGILVKSPSALERIAEIDTVAFDKTGTLTLGRAELQPGSWTDDDLRLAAGMAASSRHPLARALQRARPDAPALSGVVEEPGRGLVLSLPEGPARLGQRAFASVEAEGPADGAPEMWLTRPGRPPARFSFSDRLRPDARETMDRLRAMGLEVLLLSGDRPDAAAAAARALDIGDWTAGADPKEKTARLAALAARGRKVLMVGDGLNDAPALKSAHASLSPAAAADIAQTAADAVFQGDRLMPVAETLAVAVQASRLARQNILLSFGYNGSTVPLAVLGLVTPLIAALAMSASSMAVIGNALRIARPKA